MGYFIGKFEVRDSETGNFIDCFASIEDAKKEIKRMEKADMKDGVFTDGFYEIYDSENKEIVS